MGEYEIAPQRTLTMHHKLRILGWLALVAAGFAGQAAAPLGSTPSGRKVEAYIKAFNAGEAAMKDFFAAHTAPASLQQAPLETRLARYRQMRGRLGDLEIRRVAENKPELVSVVAQGSGGPAVAMDFLFEAAEPYGLMGIRVTDAGDEGAPPPSPKKDDAELVASVKDLVRAKAAEGAFSGVVLIARNGAPIHLEAVGDADRDKKIANRTDTKFNIGSINKAFTAIAVRKLTAEGKLRLDDPIKKFLPEYPNADAAAKVTVGHLLDMTSGIGDFFGDRYEAADKLKIRKLEDYLPLFADKPLEFEPGARSLYSNGGYVVLGLIASKASGRDYYAYVRDAVFKPAGMLDTDWYDKDAAVANRAVGYTGTGAAAKPNFDTLPGRGSSAGGGYSTAADLLKFTVALQKGVFGAAAPDLQGGFGIAGGAPGLNAALEFDPARGVAIAVLANLDPPAAMAMARQIRSWLPK
jgi:CubicO group peptidase (beta-lactamase class C family)